MRPSPQRHTLAVLRNVIGITQKEMADLAECSRPTIQAIELGKLKLSDRLGELISYKTGVHLAWLMSNNVSRPIVSARGAPYTKSIFEDFQAVTHIQSHEGIFGLIHARSLFGRASRRLAVLILRAFTNSQCPLCDYKLAKALDELEKQFGVTDTDRRLFEESDTREATDKEATAMKKDPNAWYGEPLRPFLAALLRETHRKRRENPIEIKPGTPYSEGELVGGVLITTPHTAIPPTTAEPSLPRSEPSPSTQKQHKQTVDPKRRKRPATVR